MSSDASKKNFQLFPSLTDLYFYLATELVFYSKLDTKQHISLSGGSTPKGLFSYITNTPFKESIYWNNLHFWWGDERCVEFQSEQSNYGEAKRLLFDYIDIPKRNIHFIPLDLTNTIEDYQLVAEAYASKMKQEIALSNEFPVYDWILLGVGIDGHTASIFPNDSNLSTSDITSCVLKPGTQEFRVSISANTIRAAKRVTYIATGVSKQQVVSEILNKKGSYRSYPAFFIQSDEGITEYLLDQEASSLFTNEGR